MSAGRKYLTEREFDALLQRQGGVCAVWGCDCEGPFEADHEIPNAWEPGKPTQLLCVPHHREKTRVDKKRIAKAERQAGRKGQYSRRLTRGPLIKSARKILGRGFDKTLRKLFDGSVVKR